MDTISYLILINHGWEVHLYYLKYDIQQPLELKSGYKFSKLSEVWT